MTIAVFTFSLLGAMALGMPIAFALIVCGVALMSTIGMFDSQIVAQNVLNGADSFPLMAIPFFMLAGELMNKGGLAKRIVNVALVAVGHLRGGLGYVTILASCILASLSGSAAADAAALAALLVPMMVAAGHKKSYAAGLVAAGGIIAPVIPPSIGFVIFGVAAGVSISKLFLAGIVPGLLLGAGLCVSWWWVVRKENLTPPPRASFSEVVKAVIDGFWALMLPAIIIVGLRFGIFTPTEAAVVVAVYSLFVATCIYRELKWSQLYGVFVSAAVTTSIVMFLVAAALVSSWLITVSEISTQVVDLLKPFMGNKTLLMFAIMVVVVIVGTALDMTPTILILTPILMPIIKTAGIDPVYFGVLFIINNAIGLITPPVGVVLNVVCGVSKISMEEVIKGVWPFMIAQLDRAVPDGTVPGVGDHPGKMVCRLADVASKEKGATMATKIMILNGPNLNFLGIRETHIYGSTTLKEIETSCEALANYLGITISFHQSNLEGELVNLIQSAHGTFDAIIMNPAAYSFTSIALIDALEDIRRPEDRGSYLQHPRARRVAPAFDHVERIHRRDLRPWSLRLYRRHPGCRAKAREAA